MPLPTTAASRGRFAPVLLALAAGLACAAPAHAQYFWSGGGSSDNWTDTGNWSGGPIPVPSNSTVVNFSFSTRLNSVLDIGAVGTPFDLFDLAFNPAAGNYVLSGREIRFNGGRLFYNAASTITINNNLSAVVAAGPLDIQGEGTGTLILNGNIVTSSTLAKSGAYTLLLNGANSLTGTVSVGSASAFGGTLGAASNGALGTSTSLALGSGSTFRVLGSFTQTRGISLQGTAGGVVDVLAGLTLTHNGAVSGTQFTKVGQGTIILGAATSFTGALNVNGGTLQASAQNQLGSTTGMINLTNGARLRLTAGFGMARSLVIGAGGGELELASALTTSLATLSGTGTLIKTGPGTLNLTNAGGTAISGGVDIRGGVVQTAANGSTGSGPVSISNDATLRLNSGWTNTIPISLGAGGGRIDVPTGAASYAGAMTGSRLTKTGAGRLNLTGNTLADGMHAEAGELNLTGAFSGALLSSAAGSLISGAASFAGPMQIGGQVGTPGADTLFSAQRLEALATSVFAFEFTQEGSPDYGNPTGDVLNDVLRLTGASPFAAPMAAGSTIDFYLNTTGGVDGGETFRGGIFTDNPADFSAALAGAIVRVFVRDDAGPVNYGGVNYTLSSLPFDLATVPDSAGFGLVEGRVMQLSIVPAPATGALLGLIGLGAMRRRR